jgi:hypothetical protein
MAHTYIKSLCVKYNWPWDLSELVWPVAWWSPYAVVTKYPGVHFITASFNTRSDICVTELAVNPMFDLYPQPQLFTSINMEGIPRVSSFPTHLQHPYYWYWIPHGTLSISLTNACLHCFEMVMEFFIDVHLFKTLYVNITMYAAVYCGNIKFRTLLWHRIKTNVR